MKTKILLITICCIATNLFSQTINIETTNHKNTQYFPITDFIRLNNLRSTYYEAKEKLEIIYEGNKIYFSPFSSYCKINDKVYHMTHSTILLNNNIYIPAYAFETIINKANLSIRVLKLTNKEIIISMNIYDIQDYYIDKKDNGIEISLQTTKRFLEKNIATSINSSGWLNITILDGKVDSMGIKTSHKIFPISKVNTIQLKSSAQISFLLKQKIDDIVVISNDNSIDILLSIEQASHANKIQQIRKKWLIDTVVIDAGHGGKDPGALSYNNVIKEKDITLDIAKQIGDMLERLSNINVVYTRTEDVFVPLWKRTQLANNLKGDLFISIHANSNHNKKVKGFETYLLRVGKNNAAVEVAKRENEVIAMEDKEHQYLNFEDEKLIVATMAQNAATKQSEVLADIIQTNLNKNIKSRNRGIKQAGFHVLVGASMPNVLVEVGFLSNEEEAADLNKYKYRRQIAKAIYQSILEFKNKYE